MKYFKLKADVEKYAWLTSDEQGILENLRPGKKFINIWQAIKLFQSIEDWEEEKVLSDLMHLTTLLKVISKKAKSIIENNSKNNLEFLPVEVEGSNDSYYILNVYEIVDCLNQKTSKVTHYKSSGRIMHVDKFGFHEDIIGNRSCFRIKNYTSIIVIDEDLKDVITNSGLTGFVFEDLSKENTMADKFQSILNKSRKKEHQSGK